MTSGKENIENASPLASGELGDKSSAAPSPKDAQEAAEKLAPNPGSGIPTGDSPKPGTEAEKVSATAAPGSAAEAAKLPVAPKPVAAAKPAPPPPAPFIPKPSIPISMMESPQGTAQSRPSDVQRRFEGELDEAFDAALERVRFKPRRTPLVARIKRGIKSLLSPRSRRSEGSLRSLRRVAFDGYRTDFYDEKLERDRRYGTVYSVSEEANAFLIRIEFARKVPASSLKSAWKIPDEMPDYDYVIGVADGVVSIRAGLSGEALRRLSYVSSSFPSDFLTRIELGQPLGRFVHRLNDKVLEVIVFKDEGGTLVKAA